MKKLYIFDGNNVFRRLMSVKAFQFMSYQGKPTGGMHATTKHILQQIKRFEPDEVAVTFDGAGAKAQKQKQYAGFKADRMSTMDSSTYNQMMVTADILRALGICVLHKDGVDADDTMGAVGALPNRVVIVESNDKDLLQMLDERHNQIRRHESQESLWTADRVIQHYGIRPAQMADYLAMVGDSVDGIPGLRQCGPQQAVALIARYGSLPAILLAAKKHPHEFNPKILARILAQYDELKVFLKLTTLDKSVISERAMEHIIPRLRPKDYSRDLIPLLDAHGLKWAKAWVKDHKPNVLAKPKGLWN